MKKFLKRLAKIVLLVVVVGAIVGGVALWRSRQRPDWYAKLSLLDPKQQAEAARRAQNKLSATIDWAAGRQAAELRGEAGAPGGGGGGVGAPATRPTPPPAPGASSPPTSAPKPVLSVSFTEQELNAIFQKWSAEANWEATYGEYLQAPAIALRDGRLVLAGTVKVREVDRVVSLHFRPHLDQQGDLLLDLDQVLAGQMPMPQALFDGYRRRLRDKLAGALPRHRRAARVAPDGSVNEAALKAAMGQLLLDVLDRKPSDPVLFVQANGGRTVPVKLSGVDVEGDAVTLAVEMMTARERQAFVDRLRDKAKPTATALGE